MYIQMFRPWGHAIVYQVETLLFIKPMKLNLVKQPRICTDTHVRRIAVITEPAEDNMYIYSVKFANCNNNDSIIEAYIPIIYVFMFFHRQYVELFGIFLHLDRPQTTT